jgi:hypothetical protein
LPLPSNLGEPSDSDKTEATSWMKDRGLLECDRAEFGAVFGVFHPEWDPIPAVQEWSGFVQKNRQKPVLLILGKSGGAAGPILKRLKIEVKGLRVERAGALAAGLLSALIQRVGLGFATTPWNLIGKSGSVAAFRGEGVPVVVTRNDWEWRRGRMPQREERAGLRLWHSDFDWRRLLSERFADGNSTTETVDQLREIWCGRMKDSGAENARAKLLNLEGGR